MSKVYKIEITVTDNLDDLHIKMDADKHTPVMNLMRVLGSLIETHKEALIKYTEDNELSSIEAAEDVLLDNLKVKI